MPISGASQGQEGQVLDSYIQRLKDLERDSLWIWWCAKGICHSGQVKSN